MAVEEARKRKNSKLMWYVIIKTKHLAITQQFWHQGIRSLIKWFRLQNFFVMIQMSNEIRIDYTLLIWSIQLVIKWVSIDYDVICTKLPNQKVFERPRFRWHYNLFLWIYISSFTIFDSLVFEWIKLIWTNHIFVWK